MSWIIVIIIQVTNNSQRMPSKRQYNSKPLRSVDFSGCEVENSLH